MSAIGRTVISRINTLDPHTDPAKWPKFTGYTSLNSNPSIKEIRVLRPLPGGLSDPLRFKIEHLSLATPDMNSKPSMTPATEYIALSYTWGEAKDVESIFVNDQVVAVRKTLWSFLHAIRELSNQADDNGDQPSLLWLDALCIDQSNIPERNAQVSIMGDIYASAKAVWAWLGEPTASSNAAFDYIDRAENVVDLASLSYKELKAEDLGEPEVLLDLFQRAYWTRVWIIQEIILAPVLWLFCGPRKVKFSTVERLFEEDQRMSQIWYTDDITWGPKRTIQSILETKASHLEGNRQSLWKLVTQAFVKAESTDARDHVYGLLAMATENDKKALKVDYGRTALQVFFDLVQMSLSDGRATLNYVEDIAQSSLYAMLDLWQIMKLDDSDNVCTQELALQVRHYRAPLKHPGLFIKSVTDTRQIIVENDVAPDDSPSSQNIETCEYVSSNLTFQDIKGREVNIVTYSHWFGFCSASGGFKIGDICLELASFSDTIKYVIRRVDSDQFRIIGIAWASYSAKDTTDYAENLQCFATHDLQPRLSWHDISVQLDKGIVDTALDLELNAAAIVQLLRT